MSACSSVTSFQFHNGSIKSDKTVPAIVKFAKFQFHNGSIKSLADALSPPLDLSFNSTMVRLKGQPDLPKSESVM